MKKKFLTLCSPHLFIVMLCASLLGGMNTFSYGQRNDESKKPRVVYDAGGRKVTAVYQLIPDLDFMCGNRDDPTKHEGRVLSLKRKIDQSEGTHTLYLRERDSIWAGHLIKGRKRAKFDLDLGALNATDKENIISIMLKKGSYVRVETITCGTGLFAHPYNLIAISAKKSKGRVRRK